MYIHIVCYYVLYMWSWSVFLHLENPTDRVSSQLPSNTSHKDEVNQRDENTSHINGVKPGSSITHLTVYNHPIHSIYHWEKNTYILPSGGLYATYHLFMGTRNNHWSYQNLLSIQGWFKLGYKLVPSNSHGVKKPLNDTDTWKFYYRINFSL